MVQQSTASAVNTVQKQHHPTPQTSTSINPLSACWNCGSWHFVRYCTFRTNRCRSCNRLGHKESFCTPHGQRPTQSRQTSHNSHKHHTKKKKNTNSLVATFLPNTKSNRKYVAVQLNGHPVQLQVDTASDITLISQTIGQPILTATSHVAQSASEDCVHITGELPATIKLKTKTASGTIYIANSSHNLLGLDFIEPLGLLDIPLNQICKVVSSSSPLNNTIDQTKEIMKRFSPVFKNNLGRCTHAEAMLSLKPSTKPVFRPKRPVPYAALPLVDQELKQLEEMKVIMPVTYSRWAAPIMVVKKADGSVRLCADFSTGLNAALEDHQ